MGSLWSSSGRSRPTPESTVFIPKTKISYFTDASKILTSKEYEGYWIVKASICFEEMTANRHSFVILKCQKEGVAGFKHIFMEKNKLGIIVYDSVETGQDDINEAKKW